MVTIKQDLFQILAVILLGIGLSLPTIAEAGGNHGSVNVGVRVNVAVSGAVPCPRPCPRPCVRTGCVKKRRTCFKVSSCKRSFGCGSSCKRRC